MKWINELMAQLPGRGSSALELFQKEFRDKIQEELDQRVSRGLAKEDRAKYMSTRRDVVAQMWKDVGPDTRQRFESAAKTQKKGKKKEARGSDDPRTPEDYNE